ncbi:sporulation protein [Ahniella affigens]|uniref:Sporulation protein n=1 Tax=Ahniella affigens TaxID=2021234 RepID=A0A2P1PN04_9GAMM|nr:SPOR domain-containing protein [Ahniella affigens]AVP96234.1 sporulation protein [Ahniella affigens]
MAKARAQATRHHGGERGPLPWWVWLLSGILIGLGLSAIVMMKGWAPKLRNEAPTPTPPAANEIKPAAEPEKPKYGFYEVLPEMDQVVPEALVKQANQQPAQPLDANQRYMLQAASFRNGADAESLKAKLALLGLRASVQTVAINGQDYFRVRVGPFADLRELDTAKTTLESNGLQAIALKENAP